MAKTMQPDLTTIRVISATRISEQRLMKCAKDELMLKIPVCVSSPGYRLYANCFEQRILPRE